ncbi:Glu/Leu/Phe/Val dehydrogenase [Actinomadura syzygii]|uniref:Glu/Leu/Phe/Val family dehydrogenase n=1 Tax=Actinomadura syzygii TaxID=1427538 RepID=UPI0036201683
MSDVLALMDEWGPERVVCVSDSRTGMRGVLVIDNTARGMGKGGMRMSPSVTVAEVARLARVMTYKWAGVDLFFGGAKAGIMADPAAPDREAVLRSFVRALSREIPSQYVAGLDMGLTERDAAIVQDELADRGAAVGTPHALGGMPYDELGVTGFGVAEAADAAARHAGTSLRGARVALQGPGAVGHAAARRLAELGASVVAVSTARGALHDRPGLDVARPLDLRAEVGGGAVELHGGRLLDVGAELLVPADVLVPAATQDVIDERVAADIGARIVVEGANLPTGPAAQDVLAARGITVVPDFVANAGGVVAAGFAMDARYSPFRPDPDAVFAAVSAKTRENTRTVLAAARAQGTTTHRAAVELAQRRVRAAMDLKGRLPRADRSPR